jgi:hypothetical protein
MRTNLLFIGIFALFISTVCEAQFDENALAEAEEESHLHLGIGLGQGYGGIGFRLTALPVKQLGIFGGLGYNLHKAGWNLGAVVRLMDKRVKPTLMVMYGYNAVIVVKGADKYNKTYYGPSIGGGIELHKKHGNDFWNFELIIPLRPQAYRDDLKALQNNTAITISEPPPFTIGVGYHFQF